MLNPAHILEIAFLLLAAFLIGATIGALARLSLLHLSRRPAEAAAAAVVAAIGREEENADSPSLVRSPAIDPVVKPEPPTAPAEIPTPDFREAVASIGARQRATIAPLPEVRVPTVAPLPAFVAEEARPQPAAMAPAREAGQTTSGKLVSSPRGADRPREPVLSNGPGADVIPFPLDRATLSPVVVAETGGVDLTSVAEVATEAPSPAGELEPDVAGLVEPVGVVQPASEVGTAGPPGDAAPREDGDEAAAMRAIEGNWSPRRGRASRARRTAMAPDGVEADVQANASVEAAPAGKPVGIDAPRLGSKDDLTNVIGILPIIETALNKVGIYHFDQVADLTDENVAWIEGHLGIAGRIGREHWREQARELAVVSERSRRVASKQ